MGLLEKIFGRRAEPKMQEVFRLLDGYTRTYETDHYNVSFRDSMTEFLYRHRDLISDYEILKGTMDDVFLNLTGREMAV